MNSSPDISNLFDSFEKDVKNVSIMLKNFLEEAKKIVPGSSKTCENFYKNLLQSVLDETETLAYIVNIQKIRDVFSEVMTTEYNSILYELEDQIPQIHKTILDIKKEIKEQPDEIKKEIMDRLSLAKKEALPQPIKEGNTHKNKEIKHSSVEDEKDVDKAFSVSYKVSMPDIEEDDVFIGESEEDIREKIAIRIANSINLQIKKIKEENV